MTQLKAKTLNEIQLNLVTGEVAVADLAYLAGLLDGEGCVRVEVIKRGTSQHRKQKLAVHLGIEITNTYEGVIQWLMTHFGGHIYEDGRLTGAKRSRCWSWRLYGDGAKWLIPLILPYVIIKRDELEVLLKALNLRRGVTSLAHPVEYYKRVHALSIETRSLRKSKKQRLVCHPNPNKECDASPEND